MTKTWTIPDSLGAPEQRNFSILTWTIVVGFLLSLVFHYVIGAFNPSGYPGSTFLFRPDDEFRDFTNMFFIVKDLSPYHSAHFFNSNYFPFANIFLYLFSLLGNQLPALLVFLGGFGFFYGAALVVMRRSWPQISGLAVFLVGFLNYPMLFALDRANVELYLFLAVAAFVYFYFISPRPLVAALFLAAAICMKLYPGVFVLFFLRDGRWKELGVLLAACLVFTGLPLLVFRGGVEQNLLWMFDALHAFVKGTSGLSGLQHNASLWGSIALTLILTKNLVLGASLDKPDILDFKPWIPTAYLVLVALVFLVVAAFVLVKRLKDRDAVLALTILMILLPNVSFDYKLILLLVPLMLHLPEAKDRAIVVPLSLIMIPKDYILVFRDISISVFLNVFLMLALLVVLLVRALKRSP